MRVRGRKKDACQNACKKEDAKRMRVRMRVRGHKWIRVKMRIRGRKKDACQNTCKKEDAKRIRVRMRVRGHKWIRVKMRVRGRKVFFYLLHHPIKNCLSHPFVSLGSRCAHFVLLRFVQFPRTADLFLL